MDMIKVWKEAQNIGTREQASINRKQHLFGLNQVLVDSNATLTRHFPQIVTRRE
jgi:hypothetical protein